MLQQRGPQCFRDVHRQSNFFDPGGDSISAMAMLRRARKLLGCTSGVTIRDVFGTRTLAELCEVFEYPRVFEAAPSAICSCDDSNTGPLHRDADAEQRPAKHPCNDERALGRRMCGPLQLHALKKAFVCVLQRHSVLRTVYTQMLDAFKQPPLMLNTCGLRRRQATEEGKELATRDANLPFDLERGPVIRVLVVCVRRAYPLDQHSPHRHRRDVLRSSAPGTAHCVFCARGGESLVCRSWPAVQRLCRWQREAEC